MIAPLLPSLASVPDVAFTPSWHRGLIVGLADVGMVVVVASIVLCTIRVLRGPHLADRAIAVDAIAVQLVGLVVLLTLRLGTLVLFDGVLVLSLIGFAGTLGISQYIIRRAVRRQQLERQRIERGEGGGDDR